MDFSLDPKYVCERFLSNPTKNPETNKRIKIGSKVHKELVDKCKNYIQYPTGFTKPEEILIKEYCTGLNKTTKQEVKELMKRVFLSEVEKHTLERQSFDPFGKHFCHRFVPGDKELECSSGRRSIVVLDFMNSTSTPLIQDYNFCDVSYEDKIKYYITYIPVDYSQSTLDLSHIAGILDSNCNTMLIHVDVRTGADNDQILLSKFINMVNTYLTGYEIPKVIYGFMNFVKTKLISGTEIGHLDEFLFPNIIELRVLNVAYPSDINYLPHRLRVKNVDFIPFTRLDELDNALTMTSDSNRLSCQWWFKRFFSTVFECGKGRLVQFSGTCYMTVCFNMVMLGEYAKRIFIDALNTVARQIFKPEDIEYIKYPIDYGVCVDTRYMKDIQTRLKYYAKLFYNTICGAKSLSRVNSIARDIFKDASYDYFRFDAGNKSITDDGGRAPSVIFSLLMDLGINFLISDADGKLFSPYKRDLDDIAKAFTYLRIAKDEDAFTFLTPVTLSNEPEPDIILYIDLKNGPSRPGPSVPIPSFTGFVPETANINIFFDVIDPTSLSTIRKGGHTICGFSCDGYYKLYDSAYNIIENCNWTDPKQLLNNSYAERMTRQNGWIYKNIYVQTALLVNYNRRLEYLQKGSLCEF